jgi:hypothetical protein
MLRSQLSKATSLSLRAGDWVVVRSKEEILATLDNFGRLDGLPFQPDMLECCGKRFRVAKTAHKTCDTTVHNTGGRKMYDTVHLEGARCEGKLHDGCQADCVYFWKEAWLKRDEDRSSPSIPQNASPCSEERLMQTRFAEGSDPSDPTWVCQTTAIYEASDFLPWWDIRQYIRDVTGGNHSAWHMLKIILRSGYRKILYVGPGYQLKVNIYNKWQKIFGGESLPIMDGKLDNGSKTPTEILDLKPGDLIEVKSAEEIAETITQDGFNRGMRYDPEMIKYSGRRYRVQDRIDKLINEKTGKMVRMKSPCIKLENVYCRAECTEKRLGCPRASNTYWREIWLKRVGAQESE